MSVCDNTTNAVKTRRTTRTHIFLPSHQRYSPTVPTFLSVNMVVQAKKIFTFVLPWNLFTLLGKVIKIDYFPSH